MSAHKPIALISMPTLTASFPSFQLGLLKPTLERHGITVQTFSLYLYFGTHIGWRLNDTLSAVRPCMAGEWIWSKAAFGTFSDDEAYLRLYERNFRQICRDAGCSLEELVAVRDTKSFAFLDFCMESIDWSRFELIGFSVVFQQMVASLALARRLKERHPEIPIIFGGATFEDDIGDGIMHGCPWVDYVHCGDGDKSFPELVWRLRRQESLADLPGVMWRDGEEVRFHGRAPNLTNLDATPVPDFDEYFYARKESGYAAYPDAKEPMLPIETARGCWWGMKQHCTFCGLNRAGMEFRAKSVEGVLEMLQELSRRYGILYFDAIDNIMATEYIDKLFGQLSAAHADVKIHYEVRPYLSRDQLRDLSRGGLFSVQPGIESLSTHVLTLMRKHSTGIRNLAFLKWCTYFGINNLYNILLGFPGETLEDYQLQCRVMAKIPHFQPPWGIARARADRGSPMFAEPETQSITKLYPSACYAYIYPTDRFDLEKVSYFFEHEQENVLDEDDYAETYATVMAWQDSWQNGGPRPTLRYYKSWKTLLIEDHRNGAPRRSMYEDREAELYELCNDPRTLSAVVKAFDGDETWVRDTLAGFVEKDLIIELDDRYLSLALPSNEHL